MKAIQISRTGGSDVLELVEQPTPQPAPGEVLVKAEAIGVNYFDLLIRTGRYRWMPAMPFVLGNEMSGHVVAAGENARKLKMAAHTLKGAVGCFNVPEIAEMALRLESMGRSGDLAGAEDRCQRLIEELDRFRTAIAAWAAGSKTDSGSLDRSISSGTDVCIR